jgi:hypothetical protein
MAERLWRVDVHALPWPMVEFYEGRGSSVTLYGWTDPLTGQRLLFKQYDKAAVRSVDWAVLRDIVFWTSGLPPPVARRLLPQLAVPSQLVFDADVLVGVVLRQAPAEFLSTDDHHSPREIQELGWRHERAQALGVRYFEPPHKLCLLGRLLLLICDLHEWGVVVGDLHPGNVLVTDDPRRPGVLLLDCDSWRLHGHYASRAKPARDPFPDPSRHYTQRADLYQAGLISVRCLMEYLAANDLDEHRFRKFMTSRQIRFLRSLLDPNVEVDRREVRRVAERWQARILPGGGMMNETSVGGREPWTSR